MGLHGPIWWINSGLPFTSSRNKIKYKMHWMSLLYTYTALKRVSLLVIENMYTRKELIMVSTKETRPGPLNEELQTIPIARDSSQTRGTRRWTKTRCMKGRYFLAPIFLCLQFKLYTRVQARKQKPELRINIFHFDQGGEMLPKIQLTKQNNI